jgi:hypothetical protein
MAMLENPERPIACGVLVDNGYYTFAVERYFQGFVVASARLHIWAPVTLVSICTLPTCSLIEEDFELHMSQETKAEGRTATERRALPMTRTS